MTKQEILAAAGYPNTPEGIAAFYKEYNTPDAFFAKHGGSLSGAPHDGQPTADQFFNYGSHVNDKLNVPMSNPFFLKQGGAYYGGPTRPYAYGGDISEFCWGGGLPGGPNEKPQMLHGGYHSPMNYGSFPVTSEYGGILDPSNADDYPMMEQGGVNLSKIIKAASKKMKKAYGGNTTIQGGNQNFLENRKNNFDTFIKNNIYSSLIKQEEEDMMNAFQAKRGKEKQPDDVPIDYTKALPDIFPVGRDYSQYIPANIQSQYFMSNADYAKMKDLKDRMAAGSFNLTGFEGTPEWGAMARLMGKTGRKIFGPKSVTYTYTGKPRTLITDADRAAEAAKAKALTNPSATSTDNASSSMMNDYYNQERTEYEDRTEGVRKPVETFEMTPRSRIKEEPGLKESSYLRDILLKKRNPTTGDIYPNQNYDEYNYNEFQDQARSDENIQFDPVMRNNMENTLNNLNKIKQGYGSKKYGGLTNYQEAGQTGGLTWEQYDDLKAQYAAAQKASLKNKRNDETLKFQQSFHSYEPTRQIAEGLLGQRQAANDPTAYGRTLGKDKMYSLASNEDQYFGKTTQQYLAELEKLKPKTPRDTMQPRQVSLNTNLTGDIAQSSFMPQDTTPQAQPAPVTGYKPTLTDMDVPDPGINMTFPKPSTTIPTMKPNPVSLNTNVAGDINKSKTPELSSSSADLAKPFEMKPRQVKLDTTPPDQEIKPAKPFEYKEGPEETIKSKINRKTSGIAKAIGQYAPAAANAIAARLEKQPKLDPMQNQPVVLGNRGDYDINTGDFRVHQKVPVQFPGGPGAYRMDYGGIPKALSGLEVKMQPGLYGTNGNRQFTLPTQVNSQKFAQQPTEVRGSLTAVPRDEANLEAEGGETAMVNIDGIPAHFDIKGKRHSEGGVPLNLPDNSFIFSDTASMRIKDPNIQKEFGMSYKKGGYTPAQIAKKFDINKYRKILSDPNSEDLDRKTAEAMISNHNIKLAKLGLIQESMKGFPQGIPVVAMPYLVTNQIDPAMYLPQGQQEQPDAEMGVQRYGGNIIAQYPTMQTGGAYSDDWEKEFEAIKNKAVAEEAAEVNAKKLRAQSGRDAMFLHVKNDIERKRQQAIQYYMDHYKMMQEEKKLGNTDRMVNQAYYVDYAKKDIKKYDALLSKMNKPGQVLLAKDFEDAGIKSVNTRDVHGYVVPGGVPANFKNNPKFNAMIRQGMGVVDPNTFQPVKYPMMPTLIPGEEETVVDKIPTIEEKVTQETPVKDIEIKKKPESKGSNFKTSDSYKPMYNWE